MKFDHPDYKASFSLADDWTVRTVLDYDSEIETRTGRNMYVRLWDALKAVIQPDDWHCDVPLEIGLDEAQDKKTLDIIKWAGLAGFSARKVMDADRKN